MVALSYEVWEKSNFEMGIAFVLMIIRSNIAKVIMEQKGLFNGVG